MVGMFLREYPSEPLFKSLPLSVCGMVSGSDVVLYPVAGSIGVFSSESVSTAMVW